MNIRWGTPMRSEPDVNGRYERYDAPAWYDDWPIPRVDDQIYYPRYHYSLHVRYVDWYPIGDEESNEPYVYISLSEHPRVNL